jgi:hypothetical protein
VEERLHGIIPFVKNYTNVSAQSKVKPKIPGFSTVYLISSTDTVNTPTAGPVE